MQDRVPRIDSDGPGHEGATLLFGCGERFQFVMHPGAGLKLDLELMTEPLGSRRGTLNELTPASHLVCAVLEPKSAGDGKVCGVLKYRSQRLTDRFACCRVGD